ncbi:aminotransferase class IV [Paraconexibacter antarcticus]|uniref:Aminotransferase class IV n=1 Tax=Paraconexibacter antarcticus TaxID=2949664 RepID=A0ABY5DR99_9ACTN|nr:aminotransferase class IV [Paraconexibacter antarcticus]UTI64565.1 aminotransferase class IV [Paraconexibacter antarcticus]
MELLASIDGTITPSATATVPVTDPGLLRGDGAFEVVRVYDGVPYAWDEHLRRLATSAGNLRLEVDLNALRADVGALLAQAPGFDGQFRAFFTRGGHRIVLLEEVARRGPTVSLATVEYVPTRIMDGIKSLSYAANMLATRLAEEAGAEEALLVTPHGRVLEAPTSSFFYALDGRLYTPPLEDHILDSITRRHLIEATGTEERITTRDDLGQLEEAFLASTTREVHPVSAIDGRPVAAVPGPLTEAAARAFATLVGGTAGGA